MHTYFLRYLLTGRITMIHVDTDDEARRFVITCHGANWRDTIELFASREL